MKTYSIDIGHNAPPDTGAVGIKREDDLTREIGERVIARLEALGHKCVCTKPNSPQSVDDSLLQRVQKANDNDVDEVVSIHFNASRSKKGRGCETYYISSAGKRIAGRVQKELVKLGFRDRGIKRGGFYILRNTKAPAILVEVAFCDNANDMALIEKFGYDTIANAIVLGLVTS